MTYALRPARLLLLLLLSLALFVSALLAGAQIEAANAASENAEAAALKKCKRGWNKKKCRCPANKRRVKRDGRYRCKKKAVTNQDEGGANGDETGGGTTTNPPPPPPAAELVRDDAAFEAALSNTLLRRYEEGSYGYGRYAYNFLGDHQLLYCSYYYAGSTVESNKVGTWQVVEGYTYPPSPGYTAGKIRITGSDFDVTMAVEMLGDRSNVATGNASNVFTEGAFTRAAGGAVTNCSAIS